MDKITSILKRYEKANTDRVFMAPTWREISDYVRPVKQNISTEGGNSDFRETPNTPRIAALFDTTGIEANLTYAAGNMSWLTPSESHWFSYDAPYGSKGDDEIMRWYGIVTEETRRIIALSNFYSQIHEVYLDDGAFGTSGMLLEERNLSNLRFEALQIGDYSILEDDNRNVDTVFRDLKLTARQAAQKFGVKNLHPDMQKCFEEGGKDADRKFEFIHVIMPRDDADRTPGMLDQQNMPWASLYIDKKARFVVEEGGQWECPVAVHRHLLWSHSPYGFSPGLQSLPDCRQLNYMQQMLDTLVEVQVSPPVKAPAGYEGAIDLRAGGVTYFKSQDEMPQFWEPRGNYIIGEDRVAFRQRQIRNAFHVDLFQSLSEVPVGKVMTAAEVVLRQREKLTLFSPTFARKNNELNTPIMRRVFSILLRAGAYPPPPQKLVQMGSDGMARIPDPEVIYTSRLALQIKAIHNESFSQTLGVLAPIMEVRPDMLDHFNFDKAVREVARNEGWREDWFNPDRVVTQMRQQRAQAEQQARQEAVGMEQAETIANLTKAGVPAAA